ncbi:LysM peptidoglycan-binding domain-containing protein [Neptunomonas sp.]|uniref:tetratricopeptide repeat protein n=1 Tax=Neptunomonas sp. TaxID=1971898 RepID=UPI0025DF44C1|nr:LysM peptidoglycan-binding domain-containing protein [Neptunomonas sp.]
MSDTTGKSPQRSTMQKSLTTTSLIILFCLSLSACQVTNTVSKADEDISQKPEINYLPQPELKPSKRFTLAVNLLESGQPEKARVELVSYLNEKPKSTKAKEIIRQIDTPVTTYFPQKHFNVTLKKGESLSTLSRDYLGNLYLFYALAKYNNITVPSMIDAGHTIRIPSTSKALKYKASKKPSTKSEKKTSPPPKKAVPKTANEITSIAQKPQQPKVLETTPEVAKVSKVIKAQPTLPIEPSKASPPDYLELMYAALEKRDYASATENLEQLYMKNLITPEIESNSSEIYVRGARALESKNPKLASKYYLKSAKLQIKHGQQEQSIPSLQRSLALNPNNQAAKSIYRPLQQKLTDQYHRKASIAYRKQELNKAITLWKRVLEIDPNHNAAKAYMAQAQELKAKLSKLNNE